MRQQCNTGRIDWLWPSLDSFHRLSCVGLLKFDNFLIITQKIGGKKEKEEKTLDQLNHYTGMKRVYLIFQSYVYGYNS